LRTIHTFGKTFKGQVAGDFQARLIGNVKVDVKPIVGEDTCIQVSVDDASFEQHWSMESTDIKTVLENTCPGGNAQVVVQVPYHSNVDVFCEGDSPVTVQEYLEGSLCVQTESDISIHKVRGPTIKLVSADGNIKVSKLAEAQVLEVYSQNGSLDSKKILAKEMSVSLPNGGAAITAAFVEDGSIQVKDNLSLDGYHGILNAACSGDGSVDIYGFNGALSLDVASGTASVYFDSITEASRCHLAHTGQKGSVSVAVPDTQTVEFKVETKAELTIPDTATKTTEGLCSSVMFEAVPAEPSRASVRSGKINIDAARDRGNIWGSASKASVLNPVVNINAIGVPVRLHVMSWIERIKSRFM